jgi:predicted esterase
VLLSPMVPFEPTTLPSLAGTSVFIGAGRVDQIIPSSQVDRLAALLKETGAAVTVHWHPGGHAITNDELAAAQRWISI